MTANPKNRFPRPAPIEKTCEAEAGFITISPVVQCPRLSAVFRAPRHTSTDERTARCGPHSELWNSLVCEWQDLQSRRDRLPGVRCRWERSANLCRRYG